MLDPKPKEFNKIDPSERQKIEKSLSLRMDLVKINSGIHNVVTRELGSILEYFGVKESSEMHISFEPIEGEDVGYLFLNKTTYFNIEKFYKTFLNERFQENHNLILTYILAHEFGHHFLNLLGLKGSKNKMSGPEEEDFCDYFSGIVFAILKRIDPNGHNGLDDLSELKFRNILEFIHLISANVIKENGKGLNGKVKIVANQRSEGGHGDTSTRWKKFMIGVHEAETNKDLTNLNDLLRFFLERNQLFDE
jgi:hypothetical protein